MVVDSEKIPEIIIDKKKHNSNPTKIDTHGEKVNSETSVLLSWLEIDSKPNFDMHISKLCSKSADQLNALHRLNRYLGFEEKKILVNSFIYGNFDYCPLVSHLCSKNSPNKIENIQKKGFKISFKRLWKRLQNFTEKEVINIQ